MLARLWRPRVLVYGSLLAVAAAAFVAGLATRSPFAVDVLRDRGALARATTDGRIENVYRLRMTNRTERTQRYRIEAGGLAGLAVDVDSAAPAAAAAGLATATVRLALPEDAAAALGAGTHRIEFVIAAEDETAAPVRAASTFIVPR